ncbi:MULTISPECIES: PQQ-binding-like beta-propeller repeat protein [unclassified Streptomyces]|uniref:outer membrane protein assembly factor BamB family protein n=1 Tax=unclassified Streptomyces TaxID=2593676 RepID=UPI000362C175|nr:MULTISPECIES: PQQ-binding-like beta-propeller repeat protein [unclassified Streptomyces]MYQ78410.1 PQQ-binding-like beta-propeller repeat protein [Streptomyces sp. SID4923]
MPGDDGAGEALPTTSTSKAATRPIHDPPSAFDTSQGIPLPKSVLDGHTNLLGQVGNGDLPITLYQDRVFIAEPNRMQMLDMATGELTTVAKPTAVPVGANNEWNARPVAPPLLVERGSTSIAVTSFVVNETTTGTRAAHQNAEIIAVDAGTGKATWRLAIRLPNKDGGDAKASLVGGNDGSLALRTTTEYDNHYVSYGIDSTTGRQTWTKDGFAALVVDDGVVIGATRDESWGVRPSGFDATSGKTLWRGQRSIDVAASTIASGRVLLSGSDYGSGDKYARVMSPRTGRTSLTLGDEVRDDACVYDGQTALICSGSSGVADTVHAFEATSGKLLWKLPDSRTDRIAPSVSAVWHGRVYGTANDSPVMLDATTGEDLASPGAVPIMVNESTAILKSGSTLVACPTKG